MHAADCSVFPPNIYKMLIYAYENNADDDTMTGIAQLSLSAELKIGWKLKMIYVT